MKLLRFLGSSLDDTKSFPVAVKRTVGYELSRVQAGLEPSDWKPIPSVGVGVYEIRVHDGGEYRVFYIAKRADAVYVLHAFQKKTQQTRKADIDIGKQRLKLIQN